MVEVTDSSSVSTTARKPVSYETGFCVFKRISALCFFLDLKPRSEGAKKGAKSSFKNKKKTHM